MEMRGRCCGACAIIGWATYLEVESGVHMRVVLDLTPEMQARLQAGIASHDADAVRHVLYEAVEPTVEALLTDGGGELSLEEAERLLDQMADEVAALMPTGWKGLPDYTVSREGIYEDHP